MSELSTIGKIIKALELAKVAQTGVEFTYFDAIELLGYLKSLEETIGLFEEERDALKEAGRWIPVEERLPEGPFQVQVWGRAIGNLGEKYAWCRNTAYFDMDGNWLHEWYTEKCEITHWMPLPQPPEVKHE